MTFLIEVKVGGGTSSGGGGGGGGVGARGGTWTRPGIDMGPAGEHDSMLNITDFIL
jgi:hypothetical protein